MSYSPYLLPSIFHNYFKLNRLALFTDMKLYLTHVNTRFGQRILRYKGSQLWNRLCTAHATVWFPSCLFALLICIHMLFRLLRRPVWWAYCFAFLAAFWALACSIVIFVVVIAQKINFDWLIDDLHEAKMGCAKNGTIMFDCIHLQNAWTNLRDISTNRLHIFQQRPYKDKPRDDDDAGDDDDLPITKGQIFVNNLTVNLTLDLLTGLRSRQLPTTQVR